MDFTVAFNDLVQIHKRFLPFYFERGAIRQGMQGVGIVYKEGAIVGYIATNGIGLIYRGERYDPSIHQLITIPDYFIKINLRALSNTTLQIEADREHFRISSGAVSQQYERYAYPDPTPIWQIFETNKPEGEYTITPQHKKFLLQWCRAEKTVYRGKPLMPIKITQSRQRIIYSIKDQREYKSHLEVRLPEEQHCQTEFIVSMWYLVHGLPGAVSIGSDLSICKNMIEIQNPLDTVIIMGMEANAY